MHPEAKRLARKILRQKRLSGIEFSEALNVILQTQGSLKRSVKLVEAAYQRLTRQDQRRARSSMLGFYYSVQDWKKARPFATASPDTFGDCMFTMDVFLEFDEMEKAGKLARQILRQLPQIEEEFSRAACIASLTSYLARKGEHDKALRLLDQAPQDSQTIFNFTQSKVHLHSAKALLALRNGYKALNRLEKEGDPDLAISHPGLSEGLILETRKRLLKQQRFIEKLLPKDEWKDLGLE